MCACSTKCFILPSIRTVLRSTFPRPLIELSVEPLFGDVAKEEDRASGTIYVLQSKSDVRAIAQSRDVIHKIGVTGGKAEKHISNTKLNRTYLMADVKVVATYELYNINRKKLEKLIHRFFAHAKLDIEICGHFGNPVVPQEWFLVPVIVIDQVVERIKDETISEFTYDPSAFTLVEVECRSH